MAMHTSLSDEDPESRNQSFFPAGLGGGWVVEKVHHNAPFMTLASFYYTLSSKSIPSGGDSGLLCFFFLADGRGPQMVKLLGGGGRSW